MSLLTRTKGYFVVICVLMVAFLGAFSWRLLHSSYDPSILAKHPSSIPRVDTVRRFQDEKPGEDSVKREKSPSDVNMDTNSKDEKIGSEVDIDIAKKEKSGNVKTKDERLGSQQEDESVKYVHRSVKVEDDQPGSVGSIVKLGHGSNEDEHYSNVRSRNHGDSSVSKVDTRQGGMDSQSRGEKHYKSGASPSVHKSRESVEARDQVSDEGTNGTKPFTKDEISDLLAKIHELGLSATDVKEKLSSWKQGSNKSKTVSTNSVVMPPKISNKPDKLPSYPSDDHQRVVSPGKFRVVQLPSSFPGAKENYPNDQQSVINFHVNSERARTPLQSNEIPEGKPRNPEKPSQHGANTELPSSNSDPLSRTELNRRQREKYLQLLREKFQMSKAQNMSVETRKLRTDSQMFTQIPYASQREEHRDSGSYVRGEHIHSDSVRKEDNTEREHRDSDTERREDLARPDYSTVTRRYTKSMYETLRSKYPSSDTRDQEESHSSSEVTLRPDYCRGCFDFNFKTIIDHPTLCKSSSRERSEPVFLLMLISSAPSNYHARTVIRQTWGAECRKPNSTLKCLFVIGLSKSSDENSRVQLENDHHQDILMFGFRDSYANLTYKTVTSFKWATQNCYSASYVMKTDDDMYVNSHLIPYMLQVAPRRKFMGGSCWGSSSPNRDTSSKWFVSLKSFHKPKFPPMCSGTGYIMSMDVLRSVLFASRNVPFFHLEDVYVALCLQKYGVLPVNIMGFSNMFQEFGACFYRNSVMTSHQVPPELLEDFWTSMNKCPEAHVSPSQLYIIMPYPETD